MSNDETDILSIAMARARSAKSNLEAVRQHMLRAFGECEAAIALYEGAPTRANCTALADAQKQLKITMAVFEVAFDEFKLSKDELADLLSKGY
jgi:hypothetical protein